ncbi:hypothetical protein [Thalassospira sp. MCCC 1A03138]|uniref:hypothetical protein n=1 Tax=Thalassospira sp. MCCC 1A03138 TaxID=1470576 RepID=UPI00111C567E|nr:hypothetical protein [Thalassospira sp. MCCC 1A03138]
MLQKQSSDAQPDYVLKLRELEANWRAEIESEGGAFIPDGIVSQEHWVSARRKVLFILRETNDSKGDVRESISRSATHKKTGWRGGRSKVLARVGRWAYGLLNYDGEIPPFELARQSEFEAPLSVSYINVKKITGTARSKPEEIKYHVTRYGHFLQAQIDAIAPDIVVLCGTYRVVKKYLFPDMKKVSHRVHCDNGRIFLNVYHPSHFALTSEAFYLQALNAYHHHVSAHTAKPGE